MKLSRNKVLLICALFLTVAAVALSLPIAWIEDKTLEYLLKGALFRICAGGAAACVIAVLGYGRIFKWNGGARGLIWCLPCLLVCLANFPYSALISGNAAVDRAELVPLLILQCLAIGFMEEAVFRGILFKYLAEVFKNKKYGAVYSVLISSALFGLWHLTNLFGGANVGATLLQAGYTFLTGAMFAAVLHKTENLWLCVILHALFDVGGLLVPVLGYGNTHDVCFWVLTAIAGAGCFIHVTYYLLKFSVAK